MKIKLRPASDFLNEMMEGIMKDLKWHQRLRLRIMILMDDLWSKIIMNTIYRKYKL